MYVLDEKGLRLEVHVHAEDGTERWEDLAEVPLEALGTHADKAYAGYQDREAQR